MIMGEYDRILDAQKCRGSEKIKNPIKRVISPLFPLLVNSIVRSDTMGIALEARGWNSITKKLSFKSKLSLHPLRRSWRKNDTVTLIFVILLILSPLLIAHL